MKRCIFCGQQLDPSAFYRDKSRRDGLSNGCKTCILEQRAAYRIKNRTRLRDQARADRRRQPERGCWRIMIERCHNPNNQSYPNYGGRGIRVCKRWRNSFEAFLRDMGPRPSLQHSIDRIDVDGNYEPGNCRWATPKEQARNTRTNRLLTARGRTQCLAAWAEEVGVDCALLKDRLDRLNWSAERALFTPPMSKGRHGNRRHPCEEQQP